MGVEAAGLLQGGVEAELAVLGETRAAEFQATGHHLDVAIAQRVVDHVLVLLHLVTNNMGFGGRNV